MIVVQKIGIPSLILHTKFLYHDLFKDIFLQKINNDPTPVTKSVENPNDNMRTDFNTSHIKNRLWCEEAWPLIQKHINDCANAMGFRGLHMNNLWFQQYEGNGGTHGWHVHGDNYTGCYYLEFDEKENPRTQFLYPLNLNKGFDIKVKEGDFILFPCNLAHRSSPNKSSKRKSIISFNLSLTNPLPQYTDFHFNNIIKSY